MSARYPNSAVLAGLFSNLPIESGLSDQQILRSVTPTISHKTFSRIRIAAPRTLSSNQIKFIARFAQTSAQLDAAEVIAATRNPERVSERLSIVSAATLAAGQKARASAGLFCDRLVGSAQSVYLFDRGNSFQYLAPPIDDEESIGRNEQDDCERKPSPQVNILITLESLSVRTNAGDEAIETLIDRSESAKHRVGLIDEARSHFARTHAGAFGDAKAIAVMDDDAMFVLPQHEKAVRCYHKDEGPVQRKLIAETARHFRRLQEICVPGNVSSMLRKHLSYHLPWQKA